MDELSVQYYGILIDNKKNELLIYATTWINHRNVDQKAEQKWKYSVRSYFLGTSRTDKTNLMIQI